jgi:uncharacterized DUF497 family protein
VNWHHAVRLDCDLWHNVYTWDPARFDRDANNIHKVERHRITPEEAEEVLDNDPLYQYPQQAEDEERYLVYGETHAGRMLAVAFTLRGERIRVITAYDLDADQKRRYLQERLR